MTDTFSPRGAFTALVTPFDATGAFDAHAYTRLLEFQLAQGIDGLVPCGTTGESPTLSWEEHGTAVALAVRAARDKISVVAGTGSNNTREAIEGTRDAWSRGADAALLVDCYYNGPSSLELRTEYYQRVLDAVPQLPIVPYVIPGRTGCVLASEDLAMLHLQDPERVPAVKSATGDFEHMRRDREFSGATLAILCGDDELTLQTMRDDAISACGVISVMSNIVPSAVASMCRAQLRGDTKTADQLRSSMAPLLTMVTCKATSTRTFANGRSVDVLDRFRNPVPVKTMMAGLGMLGPSFRAPLGKMTRPAVAACRQALQQVYAAAPELLTPIEEAFEVRLAERLSDDQVWSDLVR